MDYPIFFKLPFEVRCKDSAARATLSGRALIVYEDEAWWCHGVEPGGITESGSSLAMSYMAFKIALSGVVSDMAAEASGCAAFAGEVQKFVCDIDRIDAARWDQARQAMRAGAQVDPAFDNIKRETGDWEIGAKVVELQRLKPAEEDLALADRVA
jgi:hypothetical protein